MDMQNVKDLAIAEGDVRTIHDSSGNLLWGRLAYDTKYAGDTTQQTYTGKNLLPPRAVAYTETNGVVFTVDSLGKITANGTATANIYLSLPAVTLPAGDYVLSGLPSNGSGSTFKMTFTFSGTQQNCFLVTGKSFSLSEEATASEHYIFIANGYHADNLVFEPMIEAGQSKTSYEPYVGGTASPNPDYPQDIQVVTGTQTVTVSDGVNSQDYTVNLGSLELAKIGTYEDYIYKSGADWYVHKATTAVTLDGTETWDITGTTLFCTDITDYAISGNTPISNYFKGTINVPGAGSVADNTISFINRSGDTTPRFYVKYSNFANVTALTTWLTANTPTVYYALATATDTQITDSTLVAQLNAIHEWLTRYGYNSTVSGNLPLLIEQTNLS